MCVGKVSPRSTQCTCVTPLHRFGIESQKPGKPRGEKEPPLHRFGIVLMESVWVKNRSLSSMFSVEFCNGLLMFSRNFANFARGSLNFDEKISEFCKVQFSNYSRDSVPIPGDSIAIPDDSGQFQAIPCDSGRVPVPPSLHHFPL